jgi:transcriptional regulator with XRE-family HTH domain
MPPLDTGSTHVLRLVDPLNNRSEPDAGEHANLGAYLKAVREHRGRSLDDLAGATRVSKTYLSALERGDYAALPSRPFAIGYVRAVAKALDLDEDAAVARFKAESPDTSAPLQAPVGVMHNTPERRPLVAGVAAAIVIAVVGWNVVQRIVTMSEPAPAPAVPALPDANAPNGPIALGAPVPPPADQTTPAPYVTPGLGGEQGPGPPPQPNATPPSTVLAPVLDRSAPIVFTPKGAIYGVPAIGPTVVLHATKPASLIVRGPTGAVHFARQLVAGESYRAPIGQQLVSEAIDPAAFAVYINNQLQGFLAGPQTQLDKAVAQLVAAMPPAPAAAMPVGPAVPAPAAAAPVPQRPAPAPRPTPVPAPSAAAPAPAPATAPLTGAALGAPRPTGAPPPAQPAPATAAADGLF